MARRFARIPFINEVEEETTELREIINERIGVINVVMQELETVVAGVEGTDGLTPTILNNIDMSDNRVTNVAPSEDRTDVVTRAELEDLGILTRTGTIAFRVPVEFLAGVDIKGILERDDVLGLAEEVVVEELSRVAAVDGELTDLEQNDGTQGTTQGQPVMGVDGDGKQRMLRVLAGGLAAHDQQNKELLEAILETLVEIKEKLNAN